MIKFMCSRMHKLNKPYFQTVTKRFYSKYTYAEVEND